MRLPASARGLVTASLGPVLGLLFLAHRRLRADFDAKIRRTAHGIPHIYAENFRASPTATATRSPRTTSATIADSYMTVSAERSRYFGPDGCVRSARQQRRRQQPQLRLLLPADQRRPRSSRSCSPSRRRAGRCPRSSRACAATSRATTIPAQTGVDKLPDPTLPRQAVGAPDRRDGRLPALLPARAAGPPGRRDRRHRRRAAADAARRCGAAARPAPAEPRARSPSALPATAGLQRLRAGQGRDRQRPRHGARQPALPVARVRALLPGAAARSRASSTSPGASLFGVPLVLIGHTRGMAWSHTVSTACRFTPFELSARARARRRPTSTTARPSR